MHCSLQLSKLHCAKYLPRSRLVQDGQRRVNYYIKPPGPRTSPIYVDLFRSFPMLISIYILNIGAYRVQSRKTDRCIHMHAYHVMLLTHLQIFYPTFDNYSQRAACVMSEVPTFAQSPRHLVQDLEGGFSPALKWLAHHKDWICLKITLKIEQLVYPPGN